jgi:CBS domain-containing protein
MAVIWMNSFAASRLNLELCRASDIMSQPVSTIHSQETVGNLARLLTTTGHSGYPVIKKDEDSNDDIVYGFLTRHETVILYNLPLYLATQIEGCLKYSPKRALRLFLIKRRYETS